MRLRLKVRLLKAEAIETLLYSTSISAIEGKLYQKPPCIARDGKWNTIQIARASCRVDGDLGSDDLGVRGLERPLRLSYGGGGEGGQGGEVGRES